MPARMTARPRIWSISSCAPMDSDPAMGNELVARRRRNGIRIPQIRCCRKDCIVVVRRDCRVFGRRSVKNIAGPRWRASVRPVPKAQPVRERDGRIDIQKSARAYKAWQLIDAGRVPRPGAQKAPGYPTCIAIFLINDDDATGFRDRGIAWRTEVRRKRPGRVRIAVSPSNGRFIVSADRLASPVTSRWRWRR